MEIPVHSLGIFEGLPRGRWQKWRSWALPAQKLDMATTAWTATMRCLLLAGLLTSFLAGCVQPPAIEVPPAPELFLSLGDVAASSLQWQSPTLLYRPSDEMRCGPDNCERTTFTVHPLPA